VHGRKSSARPSRFRPLATLSTLPEAPLPGRPFRLTLTATEGGNAVRAWCTAAPPGSKLRKELDDSGATRVAVVPGIESGKFAELTLEKGGAYALELEELQRGNGFGGGYQGDPRGAPSEAIVDTSSASVYVATALTCELGLAPDTAKLRLYVLGDDIIRTTAAVHGVTTPALDVTATTTARARAAAETETVRAAVAALAGTTASAALGNLATVLGNLIARITGHLTREQSHANADVNNTIPDQYAVPNSAAGIREGITKFREALVRHIRNVNPTLTTGTGSAEYHANEGGVSWNAMPLERAGAGDDPLTQMVAIADGWRAYEAHRVSAVHVVADNTNRASALPPLLSLHRLFLEQLAALAPTTPPTAHGAATLLANTAGFKDS
jgi:hypothetical protein